MLHQATAEIDWNKYWNPKLFVENTVSEPSETTWNTVCFSGDGKATMCERRRVKGCFLENLELDQFPFDTQVRETVREWGRPCLHGKICCSTGGYCACACAIVCERKCVCLRACVRAFMRACERNMFITCWVFQASKSKRHPRSLSRVKQFHGIWEQ